MQFGQRCRGLAYLQDSLMRGVLSGAWGNSIDQLFDSEHRVHSRARR
jgi:hypothetical protein